MKVENLDRLVSKLAKRIADAQASCKQHAVVGYAAKYAIFVHENMEQKLKGKPRPSGKGVYWGPNGQPKFLEAPARRMNDSGELGDIVRTAVSSGATLPEALLLAALALQRESMLLVPVEWDYLRGSAFAQLEQ